MGIYTIPKSVQVNFLWGRNAAERLLDMSIKVYNYASPIHLPQTYFWLNAPVVGTYTVKGDLVNICDAVGLSVGVYVYCIGTRVTR